MKTVKVWRKITGKPQRGIKKPPIREILGRKTIWA